MIETLTRMKSCFKTLRATGFLIIQATSTSMLLSSFFIDKTIDEKELLSKYGIIIKRSFSSEPDKGPWFSARPSPGKL